jgi:hypothetical protein
MTATLKALYYQRCGCAKPAAIRRGQLVGRFGLPYLQDAACGPGAGLHFSRQLRHLEPDSGGWHDAGDYNKYIGSMIPPVLRQSWGGIRAKPSMT